MPRSSIVRGLATVFLLIRGVTATAQSLPTIPRTADLFTNPTEGETAPPPKEEKKPAKADAPAGKQAKAAKKAAAQTPPTPPGSPAGPATDAKAARAEAQTLLKTLPASDGKTLVPPNRKALRDALEERLKWIDAYEAAAKDRDAAEHPDPNPEKEAAELKSEAERAKALLDSSTKDTKKLVPELFQGDEPKVTEAKLGEMREAIDAARADVKDRGEKLEKLRSTTGRASTSPLIGIRAERDKVSQRVAALEARRAERQKAVESAPGPEEREVAAQRLVAFEWEARAEAERVKAYEAQISLGVKRLDLVTLEVQARDFQLRLAKLSLEQMQSRYRVLAESQQNDLKSAAATEAMRASATVDAIERFKAQAKAELLEQQAALINDKKAYAANPRLSFQEQAQLADRAQAEFESLKALLKDDSVSALDALQLNNDFRRVTRERNLIQRNELTEATSALAYYENQLTEVELELLSDARDDRFELENLISLLPPERHDEARAAVAAHEQEHRALLLERRAVLEKLAGRAKATHAQIVRRLNTLDDEYAFVRTNLFWIRDAEPIGVVTLKQARREAKNLLPGLVRLAAEPFDTRLWGRPSIEFGASLVGAAFMPFILLYARKALGKLS